MNTSAGNPLKWSLYTEPPNAYDLYRRLRDEAPVFRTERDGQYVLSRYVDVVDALRDHRVFSSRLTAFPMPEHLPIITMDPPKHDELRAVVSKPFLSSEVAKLEGTIRELTTHRLDALAKKNSGDLVTEFAELIPSDVIGGLLGVEPAVRPRLGRWATEFVERDLGELSAPPRAVAALAALKEYFAALRKDRDASPRDDLITLVSQAKVRGARLSDQDYAAMCATITVAGYETTTHLISHALVELFRHPDQRTWLAENPAQIPSAIKEVLRYRTPVPLVGRMVTSDVHLHGTTIPRGSSVLLILASAARDDRHYVEPDRFDIHRDDADSVAFGQGRHTCFGAPLARLEVRVVLEEVLRRFPRYEVDEGSLIPTGPGDTFGFRRVAVRLGTPS